MFVMVVLPISTVASAFCGWMWGWPVAAAHELLCLGFGVAMVEALLWGFEAMPCSQPWRPEHANLRKWWPAYLALFLFVSAILPRLERMALNSAGEISLLAGSFVLTALILRITHRRRRIMPGLDLDEPQHVQILNLD